MSAATPPPITAREEADAIIELARKIAPLDDYETQQENDEASVFILLVRAVKLYAADLKPSEDNDLPDLWLVDTALQAVRENIEMDYPTEVVHSD